VFSTAWGCTHGGVNSFNVDMCRALSAVGCDVACVVLKCSTLDRQSALSRGVKLVSADLDGEKFLENDFQTIEDALRSLNVSGDCWVGHDVISGRVARAMRDAISSDSQCVTFHHSHYLSYKGIEASALEAEAKDREQRETLAAADTVIAIGPKLAARARDMMRPLGQLGPNVSQVVPGLVSLPFLDAPNQFQLFFAGRLDGRSSRLKQVKLAAASFGRAIARSHVTLGDDPLLTLLGAGSESTQNLREVAQEHSGRLVSLHTLPFSNDRDALLQRLSSQTAAMLLSVHEGFGLTAWESIGAGVPLIVSRNSGVYQYLSDVYGGAARGCVSCIDIRASATPDVPSADDIDAVAEAILAIARDPESARRDARHLREQLRENTWSKLAADFLAICGMVGRDDRDHLKRRDQAIAGGGVKGSPELEGTQKAHGEGGAKFSDGLVTARSETRGATTVVSNPLFDVYHPAHEEHCISRPVDDEVEAGLKLGNCWIWGATATGKTTAIRRALMRHPGYVYVSLSGCSGESVSEALEHVLLELSEFLNVEVGPTVGIGVAAAIARITRILSGHSARPLSVHIDEVSFASNELRAQFVQAVGGLIVSFAGAAPLGKTRYVVSAIDDPRQCLKSVPDQTNERLSVVYADSWTTSELAHLVEVICSRLPLSIGAGDRKLIVVEAAGSPRFVKMCIRKLVSFRGDSSWSIARIVAESRAEIVQ
jgi:glycosyltransferase involved in cell wall biosynthesis